MSLKPPYTEETARQKVQLAQNLWNTQDPEKVALAYTEDSVWRNRDEFFTGRKAIQEFLTKKWQKETEYRLKKELFAFHDNRIAVQFWYEHKDEQGQWYRAYGIEHWTFNTDGLMKHRQMSANDIKIADHERWFKDGIPDHIDV
ncbi:hypothetical protein K7432_009489 [Basidiobolus ranarum]|uniref:Uncharacterized protein n=1 Tax=Basidiobolus ranarum TaxID=34480 RepID=A0ABR2VX44_9FUNG